MTIADSTRAGSPIEHIRATVPLAIENLERIPTKRYYDPEFFEWEKNHLWTRTWQMACRLEEIPNVGDFMEYTIIDKSVIVVRESETVVKAFQNVCPHRGNTLVRGTGNAKSGFVCGFHGWCWNTKGENTFVYQPHLFSEALMDPNNIRLREVKSEIWGGNVFINFDLNAASLKERLDPFYTNVGEYNIEHQRTVWWYAVEVPANWKVGVEAFMEGYHVLQTHPQLMPKNSRPATQQFAATQGGGSSLAARLAGAGPEEIAKATNDFLTVLGHGMDSWILEKDLTIAAGMRANLPENVEEAIPEYRRQLNDAIVEWNRSLGMPIADLNALEAAGNRPTVNPSFPNYFTLPYFGNSTSYRFRPLTPDTMIFEMRSMTLFPEGEAPECPKEPTWVSLDDPRWPAIPVQDFGNIPNIQIGLKAPGLEYTSISHQIEGRISRFHQLIDGYLAGVDEETLTHAHRYTSGPIDVPIVDIWTEES